jgi:tetratricopeptide (TPR) repeat protein
LDRKNLCDDAIRNFSQAIQIDSSKPDFFNNRAFAYRKLKKYEEAIADYSQSIKLNGENFKAYYNRALCYDKLKLYR